MGERHYCGLDIGSQTVKVAMVKTREHHPPVLSGVYEVKTAGYKKASVTDLGELTECIQMAVEGLSKKTGVKVREVQLGIGGEMVESRYSSGVIPLIDRGNKEITARDVKKVQAQAKSLGVNMDETILHVCPQFYKVDDVNTALNPVGLFGRKMEIHTLLIVAQNTFLKNFTKAVNQAGYEAANLIFSSFAAAQTSLNEMQKKNGCILIDMGSDLTELLIFRDGQMKFFANISMGGEQVTRSIAQELNLAFDLAEDIKKSYGFVMGAEDRSQEEILVKREEGYLPVKKEKISSAIEPLIQRWIELIQEKIKVSGYQEQVNTGMILVGGNALLPGLPEKMEKALGLPVKLGDIDIVSKRLQNAAKYAAAVGMAIAASSGTPDVPFPPPGEVKKPLGIIQKITELYQEYF